MWLTKTSQRGEPALQSVLEFTGSRGGADYEAVTCRFLLRHLSPRVRRHQVVRAIVDHELAIVLAAVLDGEHPGVGIVD